MGRPGGSSVELVIRRREVISQYIDKNPIDPSKPMPIKEIQKHLKNRGFKDRGYHTIRNDLAYTAQNNSFVRDIASKRYSQIMEDCYETNKFVMIEARKIFETKWTGDKIVKKHIINKDADDPDDAHYTEIIETKTDEYAEPKLRALTIMLEANDRIHKMINGDGLRVSVDAYIQDTKRSQEDIQKLQAENQDLKQSMKQKGKGAV